MRRHLLMVLLATAVLLLSACTSTSAQEEIYDHLEKAVTLEDSFRAQQQPLVELEKKEQKLYNQIIDLNMNEFDKIKKLSKEAAGIVEERREKLELERESIEAAKEEFDKIKPLIDELGEEEADAKKKAKQLIDAMQNRYDAYESLYKTYDEALTLDAELYEMLQNKDLTEEKLKQQIKEINESYSKVIEANKQFNKYTEQYNQLKKELYEALGFQVTYKESKSKDSGE